MSNLNVALVQSFTHWHNPQKNLVEIQKQIDQINKNVDLVILPEMWITGFTMKNHLYWKDTLDGVEKMKEWSLKLDALIIGTLITKVNEQYYNRAYVISKGNIIHTYDKKHLFAFSGENRFFESGSDKCIFEYKKWKICLNICYDLRFPVWTRNNEDYDILIYSANWPDKRLFAWDSLLIARAIENQSYVLGVNCTGTDAWHNTYSGHSSIVNFDGQYMQILKDKPGVLNSTLDLEKLKSFREKFPFLKDRDIFSFQ